MLDTPMVGLSRSLSALAVGLQSSPEFEAIRGISVEAARAVDYQGSFSTRAISDALVQAMETQRTQLAALGIGSSLGSWWSGLVAESLAPTSRMVGDLTAMKELLSSSKIIHAELGAVLSSGATRIVAAERLHLTTALAGLALTPSTVSDQALRAIVMPSAASAMSVAATRRLLEPIRPEPDRPDVSLGADTLALASRLKAVHPMLETQLLGAWERVDQGGPDWQRANDIVGAASAALQQR